MRGGGFKRTGRPKGRKDSVPNPERRETARRNGSQQAVLMPDEVYEKLRAAKGVLGKALAEDGVPHLQAIIKAGPAKYVSIPGGGREVVEGSEQFEWAMNFVADRCGMPRRSEAEVVTPGGFTISVTGVEGGLGWPRMAADAGADEQRVAH